MAATSKRISQLDVAPNGPASGDNFVIERGASANYRVDWDAIVAGMVADMPVRSNSIVLFGDSRTADNTITGGAPAYINRWSNVGWFPFANALAGWPFDIVYNAGVGGNTTTQMLARISTDVLAYKPSFCTVFGGTNDFTGPSTQSARIAEVTTVYNNLVAIYQILAANGIYVFAISETPDSSSNLNKQYEKIQLNNLLREYWRGRPGGEFVDFYSVMVNYSDANAAPLSGYMRDGLHFNTRAGYVGGKLLSAALTKFAGNPLSLVSTVKDYYGNDSAMTNICQNSLMTGTSGTLGSATGQIPTSWTYSGNCSSCAASVVARADGVGNDIVLAMTAADSTQFGRVGISMPQAFVVPGATYVCSGEITIQSPTNLGEASLAGSFSNGNAQNFSAFVTYDTSGTFPEGFTMRFRSPPLVMPAGTYVGASLSALFSFRGAGSATAKLGRVAARRIA